MQSIMNGITGIFSSALNGLQNASNQMTATAARIASPGGASLGSLSSDLVSLSMGNLLYSASAKLINTADQAMGTLLDVVGNDGRGNK